MLLLFCCLIDVGIQEHRVRAERTARNLGV